MSITDQMFCPIKSAKRIRNLASQLAIFYGFVSGNKPSHGPRRTELNLSGRYVKAGEAIQGSNGEDKPRKNGANNDSLTKTTARCNNRINGSEVESGQTKLPTSFRLPHVHRRANNQRIPVACQRIERVKERRRERSIATQLHVAWRCVECGPC